MSSFFSAETETCGDLVKAGVIDLAKVESFVLRNASSEVGLMLETEAVMAGKPEKEHAPLPGRGMDKMY